MYTTDHYHTVITIKYRSIKWQCRPTVTRRVLCTPTLHTSSNLALLLIYAVDVCVQQEGRTNAPPPDKYSPPDKYTPRAAVQRPSANAPFWGTIWYLGCYTRVVSLISQGRSFRVTQRRDFMSVVVYTVCSVSRGSFLSWSVSLSSSVHGRSRRSRKEIRSLTTHNYVTGSFSTTKWRPLSCDSNDVPAVQARHDSARCRRHGIKKPPDIFWKKRSNPRVSWHSIVMAVATKRLRYHPATLLSYCRRLH